MLQLKKQHVSGNDAQLRELRALLLIDKDALDEAVMRQPVLFDQVAEQYTLLVSRRDQAKTDLEDVMNAVSLEIRRQMKKEKCTEGEIKARVEVHKDVKKAEETYNKLIAEAAKWGTLKESYVQRGHALRELCGLFADEYWQRSSMKGGHPGDRLATRGREGQKEYGSKRSR